MILGIESSCDETAAAVITPDGRILSNVVSSQADLHARYGGVVPEVASRRHLELVAPVVQEALRDSGTSLDDVDLVGVTAGPGLIGALLVGVAAAKAIAWARRLPLAAFDKGARLLGLGYPGGAEIDRIARADDPGTYEFPVARVPGLDFSFSGVKTALLYAVRDLTADELEPRRADLAASYQRAIVRALVERTRQAADEIDARRIAVVGGVAANSELRAALPEAKAAPLALCTDNAAMIASAARFSNPIPYPGYLGLDAYASTA